jgi:hypothetical protein
MAPSTLKGTDYFVKEQFPPEIENKRKSLYSVAKDARKNPGNKVRLVRDKLFINNKLYKEGDSIPKTQNTNNIHDASLKTNYTQGDTTQQQTNGIRTRTFTRRYKQQERKPITPGPACFFSQNRFSLLTEDTPRREHLAGKTKAKSPLDQDVTLKKHREASTTSESETETEHEKTLIDSQSGQNETNLPDITGNRTNNDSYTDQGLNAPRASREITPTPEKQND